MQRRGSISTSRRCTSGTRPQTGLGAQFLAELDASYNRIVDGPFKYRDLGFEIRRALLRRFPYAVYFAVESDVIAVLAVLHVSRDPAEWQRLRA